MTRLAYVVAMFAAAGCADASSVKPVNSVDQAASQEKYEHVASLLASVCYAPLVGGQPPLTAILEPAPGAAGPGEEVYRSSNPSVRLRTRPGRPLCTVEVDGGFADSFRLKTRDVFPFDVTRDEYDGDEFRFERVEKHDGFDIVYLGSGSEKRGDAVFTLGAVESEV